MSTSKIVYKVQNVADLSNQVTTAASNWATASKTLQEVSNVEADLSTVSKVIGVLGKFSAALGAVSAVAGFLKLFFPSSTSIIMGELKKIEGQLNDIENEISQSVNEIEDYITKSLEHKEIFDHIGTIETVYGALTAFEQVLQKYQNSKSKNSYVLSEGWEAFKTTYQKNTLRNAVGQLAAILTGKSRSSINSSDSSETGNDTDQKNIANYHYFEELVTESLGNIPLVLQTGTYFLHLFTKARRAESAYLVFNELVKQYKNKEQPWEEIIKQYGDVFSKENYPNGFSKDDHFPKIFNSLSSAADDVTSIFYDPYFDAVKTEMNKYIVPETYDGIVKQYAQNYVEQVCLADCYDWSVAHNNMKTKLPKQYPWFYWAGITTNSTEYKKNYYTTGGGNYLSFTNPYMKIESNYGMATLSSNIAYTIVGQLSHKGIHNQLEKSQFSYIIDYITSQNNQNTQPSSMPLSDNAPVRFSEQFLSELSQDQQKNTFFWLGNMGVVNYHASQMGIKEYDTFCTIPGSILNLAHNQLYLRGSYPSPRRRGVDVFLPYNNANLQVIIINFNA